MGLCPACALLYVRFGVSLGLLACSWPAAVSMYAMVAKTPLSRESTCPGGGLVPGAPTVFLHFLSCAHLQSHAQSVCGRYSLRWQCQ